MSIENISVSLRAWHRDGHHEYVAALLSRLVKADVFIGAWIDADRIDLQTAPEFLGGCARHGLPVALITND
jgi:hypothetical protein